MAKILYQTLEDRNNPEEVLANAPFVCRHNSSWLGEGFYFWDTFIENAHWWGDTVYVKKKSKGYMICKATCTFDISKCFDLVGETEHMLIFNQLLDEMKSALKITEDITVARFLNYHRTKTQVLSSFEAIRVYGVNSIRTSNEEFTFKMKFKEDQYNRPNQQYLDYKPAIQICLYSKKSLDLRNLEICFPDKYVEEMVF